ncbi:hypothetical protein PS938_01355 [Pseudomonas fluorescens]|uniref:Macro domain-containing protein n=1 Tax=Pseudomonas fluorescens TaxID=294 RepID=A0A5E7SP27_PSEFL|nr:macro domain-containing protein [Pseudomonas fluorescens]VVP88561.1 hypothetical protein PS938_01355 [Pseudomonas fluorescens]
MIEFVSGDFFDFEADIRVNTVNCAGVMGAGVALAFKNKYPEMFKEYALACKNGEYKPGRPKVWRMSDMFDKEFEIINFPTKNHWRRPSEYKYIEDGLVWLENFLSSRPGVKVTLPALGCGHGGLDWNIVKSMIEAHLKKSPASIYVFEPHSSRRVVLDAKVSRDSSAPLDDSILVLDHKSDNYPQILRSYTNKNLYVFGDIEWPLRFDVSIISSTKPDEEERKAIVSILNKCRDKQLSILFGASASDKKLAAKYTALGLYAGVFLPSGIKHSVAALKDSNIKNLTLLSIGSPDSGFDKKEYLPAVISRILFGGITIFTTKNLEWLSKHKVKLENKLGRSFFIEYPNIGCNDIQAASELGILPASVEAVEIFYEV